MLKFTFWNEKKCFPTIVIDDGISVFVSREKHPLLSYLSSHGALTAALSNVNANSQTVYLFSPALSPVFPFLSPFVLYVYFLSL